MTSQKITTSNYFDTIKTIGFENLPLVLKQSHTVISTKTVNGEDWSKYKSDSDLKRMIDLVFKKLEEFIQSTSKKGKSIDGINEKSTQPKNEKAYSTISVEIKFIQRFLEFHDKILYKKTFEIFIDELQKAIKEKLITKKSPVAKDIISIQRAVVSAFNSMGNAKHFVLKDSTRSHYKKIIEKYENAYEDIDTEYLKTKKKPIGLNGLNQISINEESQTQQPTHAINLMSSKDFTNLKFNTIGFKDKWLSFIGDPAPGFTAMVFGMPKMGKSYLCVDFAGYLARNHGKVLYVAKEEKLDKTLQDKINDMNVSHDNLTVADGIPNDLSSYDFIFLDSVNKLGLSSKDLEKLKVENKGKSFIYIFQATKSGQFKGNNEFQHDVDVVIEIPERGRAIQYGRFNQGGEMNVFSDDTASQLNGIKKSVKPTRKLISNSAKLIKIKAELGIPLEELALELIPENEPKEGIVELIDKQPAKVESAVKLMAEQAIADDKLNIKVVSVTFKENDSNKLTTGASYYTVELQGNSAELKKIAGEDKLFCYEW